MRAPGIVIALGFHCLSCQPGLAATMETPADVVRAVVQASTISAKDDELARRFTSQGFQRDMKAFYLREECGPWDGNFVGGGQGVERLNALSITEISRTDATALVDAKLTSTMTEDEGGQTGKPFVMTFVLLNEGGRWRIDEFIERRSSAPSDISALAQRIYAARHTLFRAVSQNACGTVRWPD